MTDYEQRQSPEFREKFGHVLADVDYLKNDVGELKALLKGILQGQGDVKDLKSAIDKISEKVNGLEEQLKKHVAEDVPFTAVLRDKWAYISLAAVSYILWQLFTLYANRAIEQVDTFIAAPRQTRQSQPQPPQPKPARGAYPYQQDNGDEPLYLD